MTMRLKRAIGLGLAAVVIALLVSLGGANAGDGARSTVPVAVPAAAPSSTGEQAGQRIIPAADIEMARTKPAMATNVRTEPEPSLALGAGKSIPALT